MKKGLTHQKKLKNAKKNYRAKSRWNLQKSDIRPSGKEPVFGLDMYFFYLDKDKNNTTQMYLDRDKR